MVMLSIQNSFTNRMQQCSISLTIENEGLKLALPSPQRHDEVTPG